MAKVLNSEYFMNTILRIAMSSIWLYAGIIGKLMNPGFLNPASTQYVGFTIQYLAQGSLIKGFLYAIAIPHPQLVGILVIIGEISFGILTLFGLMTKLANTVAFYTNLIYFLSASWTGADEYGLNLLMMIIDAYFIAYGSKTLSIDSLISAKVKSFNNTKIWLLIGTVIYIVVIIYLLFSQ
ncbi:MAG: TQO small subunit DoxD [Saccharolobus sp.]